MVRLPPGDGLCAVKVIVKDRFPEIVHRKRVSDEPPEESRHGGSVRFETGWDCECAVRGVVYFVVEGRAYRFPVGLHFHGDVKVVHVDAHGLFRGCKFACKCGDFFLRKLTVIDTASGKIADKVSVGCTLFITTHNQWVSVRYSIYGIICCR